MNLPKIRALDLRALDVIVAEHNARPGALHLGVWKPEVFRQRVRNVRFRRAMDAIVEQPRRS